MRSFTLGSNEIRLSFQSTAPTRRPEHDFGENFAPQTRKGRRRQEPGITGRRARVARTGDLGTPATLLRDLADPNLAGR